MTEHIVLGERLEILSTANEGRAWSTIKEKRGIFAGDQHHLDTKDYHDLILSDLICFKGSQGEQTDGSDDYDDVVRFSKDYTIRALTTSKAGGRFLTTNGSNAVYSISNADVTLERGFNKTCLFKIRAVNESSRGISTQSMFAEEVYPNVKVVFESTSNPGKFICINSGKTQISMEGISERCVFTIRRANLKKYLKDSDETAGKVRDGICFECQKKIGSNWVARSKTEHYVDSSGKTPLGTMDTLDGLGTWRVEQRDGCDLQGWDYGAGRWEHFLDKKRRPFQYTGKETTRCRKWVHTNSRYYSDSTGGDGENDDGKGNGRRSTFATGAGELGKLSFIPDVHEAMKQAAVNTILEEGILNDSDLNDGSIMNEEGGDNSVPGTPTRSSRKGKSDGTSPQRGSTTMTPKKSFSGDSPFGFDEKELLMRDNSDKALWSMSETIETSDSWSGDVWIRSKWISNDDDKNIQDGAVMNKICAKSNTPITSDDSNNNMEEDNNDNGDSSDNNNDDEKKEDSTNNNNNNNNNQNVADAKVKVTFTILGKEKQAKIILNNSNGDSDDEQQKEIILDLNNLTLVKVIKDEKMAHDSLALAEKSEWISRSGRLEAQVAALKEKRKGLTKLEQQPVTKKINQLLMRRLAYKDQALGRPEAEGWLKLQFAVDDGKNICEWVISPIEPVSSFVYGVQEGNGYIQGKRDNYRNQFEICRQVLVDNLSSDISKEMDAEFVQSIAKLCTDLAGMTAYQAKNCARDATMQAKQASADALEREKKLAAYQKEQMELLEATDDKIFDVINNNKTTPFVNACDEWLVDIDNTEKISLDAAKEGLEILEGQTGKLEHVLDTMKKSAEMQALLTLQYAVPLIPGSYKDWPWKGSREWRDKLERGEASGLDKMIDGLEKKAKKEAGIPVISNPLEISSGKDDSENKDTSGASSSTTNVKKEEQAKDATKTDDDNYKEAHEAEIAEETTTLLHGFARQPEEWENHKSICVCICWLLCINIILFAIYNIVPSPA